MPKITQGTHEGRIVWDSTDWLSGLHPAFSAASTDTPVPVGNGQLTFASAMNPYRNFGYASPGFNPTDATNVSVVTNSPIRKIVIGAESGTYYGYGVDYDTKLFQIDTTTAALTNAGIWPQTINTASGTVQGEDCVVYSARVGSTRAPRLFYSFNNAGAAAGNPLWNIGMYALDNVAGDDDFMTTAPATPLAILSTGATVTNPHPLIVGDDDVLYVGDGNIVHAYDGADTTDPDGKFIVNVLVLPENFRITSFAKLKQRLAIFGYIEMNTAASAGATSFYATDAKAYFWDYLSNDPYDSVNLNDNYCNAAFEYRGTIGVFTQGRKPVAGSNQVSKMLLYNGTKFNTITMFPSNIPINGSVQIVGDTVMFNAQGVIYQYGCPFPGFPNGLNRVAAGTGTNSGALLILNTTTQLASTGITTSGGLQKISSSYTTGSFAAALAQPSFAEGLTGRMKSVTVTFAKTSSGGRDITVNFIGNDLTTTAVLANVSTVDSTNIKKKYEFDTSGNSLPKFDDVKPVVVWGSGSASSDAPILQTIELVYETVALET